MWTRDFNMETQEGKTTDLFGLCHAENPLSIVNITYYTVEAINGDLYEKMKDEEERLKKKSLLCLALRFILYLWIPK